LSINIKNKSEKSQASLQFIARPPGTTVIL
jgi:hypothetical protein